MSEKKSIEVVPPRKEGDPEDLGHARWAMAATAIGYNHIAANDVKTLGEKLYFRLARDKAIERLEELGGKSPIGEPDSPAVLTIELPDGMPHIIFRECDIEMMRAAVATHDAQRLPPSKDPVIELAREWFKGERPNGEMDRLCALVLARKEIAVGRRVCVTADMSWTGIADGEVGEVRSRAPDGQWGVFLVTADGAREVTFPSYMLETVDDHAETEEQTTCTECTAAGLYPHERTDDITKSCPVYDEYRRVPATVRVGVFELVVAVNTKHAPDYFKKQFFDELSASMSHDHMVDGIALRLLDEYPKRSSDG